MGSTLVLSSSPFPRDLKVLISSPDNEDKQPGSYTTLARTFRSLFASAVDKSYYLSSAPECPFPDESNPTDMLLLCDFVFVQFYNNPSCDIGSAGYETSLRQWASALEKGVGRWFLGAPAVCLRGFVEVWKLANPALGIVESSGANSICEYRRSRRNQESCKRCCRSGFQQLRWSYVLGRE
jgi:hypothetical protein